MRQLSREWRLPLNNFLVNYGFVQSKAGSILYVWTRCEKFVIIVVYVDGILMSRDSDESLGFVVKYFKGKFNVRVD